MGASCTNTNGIDNAFQTASSLVNPSTGASPGLGIPLTLTVPTAKLNSLANALATCTTTRRSSLLLAAVQRRGLRQHRSGQHSRRGARHRSLARRECRRHLCAGRGATPCFRHALSAAPPDWMLHNTVSGGGMNMPTSIGVAASGNVWVSSYFDTVSEFSPGGAAIFPSGITGSGINESYGMALDPQGNVWIANEQTTLNGGAGNMTELNSAGQPLATGLNGGGINFPIAVASDTNGNMWIADYGDSKVTLLSNSGLPLSGSAGWGGTSLAFPVAVAVDSRHNAWIANQGGLLPVTEISADGSAVAKFDCDCDGASGIATDRSGNIWIANYYGNSISEVDTCGTLKLDAAKGGGVLRPQAIAVDGAGTVWVANYQGNSLSEIDGATGAAPGMFLSPSTGFGVDASLLGPYSLAIDASGSIWLSNSGKNTLTQFIGVAAPVKTPLAGPPQSP